MKQNPESVSKTLIKHGILGVECSEKRKSIRLEGELADWAQIVKAGKLAAKAGYKGVINDIRLAGFDPPAVRQPETRDASLEGRAPDVLIIGCGVIGCSIAR